MNQECGNVVGLFESGPNETAYAACAEAAGQELQTPLTSIRAFAEILLNNPDMEAQLRQQFLRIVVAETKRLSQRIDETFGLKRGSC